MLKEEDAPPNFTLVESRQKNMTEVTGLALDLGWDGGYIVRYADQSAQPTVISQTIAFYPAKRMQMVLKYVQNAGRSHEQYTVEDLPDPMLGDLSGASVAYTRTQQSIASQENFRQDVAYYEILFTKGSVFEVFRISGPSADYKILSDLAQTALNRI